MQRNTGGTILEANAISNIGKLAKTVYSDSFRVELSSLIPRKLMIAGRYAIRMTNHPRHPFPYLQPMIITSLALPMHHLQNTVSQTGYPNNKEGDLFIRSEMETNARPGSIRSYVNRFLWLKRQRGKRKTSGKPNVRRNLCEGKTKLILVIMSKAVHKHHKECSELM